MESALNIKGVSYNKKMIMFFWGSFCIGIIIANVIGSDYLDDYGIISSYFLQKYEYMDINSKKLFYYILFKRVPTMTILWFLGLTSIGGICVLLFTIWTGFSLGMILSVCIIKFNLSGILLFTVSIMPQYIFYICSFVMLVVKVGGYSKYRINETRKAVKNNSSYFIVFMLSMGILILGAAIEGYINPLIVKKVLKLF